MTGTSPTSVRRCPPRDRTDVARLVLVGLPGAGKTTLASVLAQHWDCEAIDTDEVLAIQVGVPAATYLREHGEEEFRLAELDALRTALASNAIVATGAGVVTTAPARTVLAKETVLWLDCDDETLDRALAQGNVRFSAMTTRVRWRVCAVSAGRGTKACRTIASTPQALPMKSRTGSLTRSGAWRREDRGRAR